MADYVHSIKLQFTADTNQAMSQMRTLSKNLQQITNLKADNMGINSNINKAVESATKLKTILQNSVNLNTGDLNISKFTQQLAQAKTSIGEIGQNFASVGSLGAATFRSLSSAISTATVPLKQTNGLLKSMMTSLANTVKWQISSSAIHGLMSGFSSALGYVKDLNTSLNDIRIVTGQSVEDMARFAQQANKAAKALSTTTNAYAKASLIYYQQGDSSEQAAKKAAITLKAANASFNTSAEQMSEYLTAVWNSYQVGADELERYVDIMAALGAKTATSLEEIATSMQKVAATANAVGVSMEEVSSIISTVSSVTRESAESIGTSFKTIFARIGDLKLGDTLEDGVGLGQVSSALKKINVDILDSAGNMREMGDIITDLGNRWQTLSQAQKTATAQVVAGKRQYTQFMALFENLDMYNKNLNIAENAEGSLQNMQDIYAESWVAASAKVRAAWEGVWDSLLNDEALIKMTNSLAEVVKGIEQVVDTLGGLPGVALQVGTTLSTVFSKNIATGIDSALFKMKQFGMSFKGIGGFGAGIKSLFFQTTNQRLIGQQAQNLQVQLQKSADPANVLNQNHRESALLNIKQQLLTVEKDLRQEQKASIQDSIAGIDAQIQNIQDLIMKTTEYMAVLKGQRSKTQFDGAFALQNMQDRGILVSTGSSAKQTVDSLIAKNQYFSNDAVNQQFATMGNITNVESAVAATHKLRDAMVLTESAAESARGVIDQYSKAVATGGDKSQAASATLDALEDHLKALSAAGRNLDLGTEFGQEVQTIINKFHELKSQGTNPEQVMQSISTALEQLSSTASGRAKPAMEALKNDLNIDVTLDERLHEVFVQMLAIVQQGNSTDSTLKRIGTTMQNVKKSAGQWLSQGVSGIMAFSSSVTTMSSLVSQADKTITQSLTAWASLAANVGMQLASGSWIGALLSVIGAGVGYFLGMDEKAKKEKEDAKNKSEQAYKDRVESMKTQNSELQSLIAEFNSLYAQKQQGLDVDEELAASAEKLASKYNVTGASVAALTGDYDQLIARMREVDTLSPGGESGRSIYNTALGNLGQAMPNVNQGTPSSSYSTAPVQAAVTTTTFGQDNEGEIITSFDQGTLFTIDSRFQRYIDMTGFNIYGQPYTAKPLNGGGHYVNFPVLGSIAMANDTSVGNGVRLDEMRARAGTLDRYAYVSADPSGTGILPVGPNQDAGYYRYIYKIIEDEIRTMQEMGITLEDNAYGRNLLELRETFKPLIEALDNATQVWKDEIALTESRRYLGKNYGENYNIETFLRDYDRTYLSYLELYTESYGGVKTDEEIQKMALAAANEAVAMNPGLNTPINAMKLSYDILGDYEEAQEVLTGISQWHRTKYDVDFDFSKLTDDMIRAYAEGNEAFLDLEYNRILKQSEYETAQSSYKNVMSAKDKFSENMTYEELSEFYNGIEWGKNGLISWQEFYAMSYEEQIAYLTQMSELYVDASKTAAAAAVKAQQDKIALLQEEKDNFAEQNNLLNEYRQLFNGEITYLSFGSAAQSTAFVAARNSGEYETFEEMFLAAVDTDYSNDMLYDSLANKIEFKDGQWRQKQDEAGEVIALTEDEAALWSEYQTWAADPENAGKTFDNWIYAQKNSGALGFSQDVIDEYRRRIKELEDEGKVLTELEKEAILWDTLASQVDGVTTSISRLSNAINKLPTDLKALQKIAEQLFPEMEDSIQALIDSSSTTRAEKFLAWSANNKPAIEDFTVESTVYKHKVTGAQLSKEEYDKLIAENAAEANNYTEETLITEDWGGYVGAMQAYTTGITTALQVLSEDSLTKITNYKNALDALTSSYANFLETGKLSEKTKDALLLAGIDPDTITSIESYKNAIDNLSASYVTQAENLQKLMIQHSGNNNIDWTKMSIGTSWMDFVAAQDEEVAAYLLSEEGSWLQAFYEQWRQYMVDAEGATSDFNSAEQEAAAAMKEVNEEAEKQTSAWDKITTGIQEAQNLLNNVDWGKSISSLTNTQLVQLEQALMDVYGDAQLVDNILKNLGKDNTLSSSAEAIMRKAEAQMSLALAGAGVTKEKQVEVATMGEGQLPVEAELNAQPPLSQQGDEGLTVETIPANLAVNAELQGNAAGVVDPTAGALTPIEGTDGIYRLVTNPDDNTVSLINLSTGEVITPTPAQANYLLDECGEGNLVHIDNGQVAGVAPADAQYILSETDEGLHLINVNTGELMNATPTANKDYVLGETTDGLKLINPTTGEIINTTPTANGQYVIGEIPGDGFHLIDLETGQFKEAYADATGEYILYEDGDNLTAVNLNTGELLPLIVDTQNGTYKIGEDDSELGFYISREGDTLTLRPLTQGSQPGTYVITENGPANFVALVPDGKGGYQLRAITSGQNATGANYTIGETITTVQIEPDGNGGYRLKPIPTQDVSYNIIATPGTGISGTGTAEDPFTIQYNNAPIIQRVIVEIDNPDLDEVVPPEGLSDTSLALLHGRPMTAEERYDLVHELLGYDIDILDIREDSQAYIDATLDAWDDSWDTYYRERGVFGTNDHQTIYHWGPDDAYYEGQDYVVAEDELQNSMEIIELLAQDAEYAMNQGNIHFFDDFLMNLGEDRDHVIQAILLWVRDMQDMGKEISESGKWFIQGLINGMDPAELTRHLHTIGDLTIEELNQALGIASPSKYTIEMGKWLMKGLSEGFANTEFEAKGLAKRVMAKIAEELEGMNMEEIWAALSKDHIIPALDHDLPTLYNNKSQLENRLNNLTASEAGLSRDVEELTAQLEEYNAVIETSSPALETEEPVEVESPDVVVEVDGITTTSESDNNFNEVAYTAYVDAARTADDAATTLEAATLAREEAETQFEWYIDWLNDVVYGTYLGTHYVTIDTNDASGAFTLAGNTRQRGFNMPFEFYSMLRSEAEPYGLPYPGQPGFSLADHWTTARADSDRGVAASELYFWEQYNAIDLPEPWIRDGIIEPYYDVGDYTYSPGFDEEYLVTHYPGIKTGTISGGAKISYRLDGETIRVYRGKSEVAFFDASSNNNTPTPGTPLNGLSAVSKGDVRQAVQTPLILYGTAYYQELLAEAAKEEADRTLEEAELTYQASVTEEPASVVEEPEEPASVEEHPGAPIVEEPIETTEEQTEAPAASDSVPAETATNTILASTIGVTLGVAETALRIATAKKEETKTSLDTTNQQIENQEAALAMAYNSSPYLQELFGKYLNSIGYEGENNVDAWMNYATTQSGEDLAATVAGWQRADILERNGMRVVANGDKGPTAFKVQRLTGVSETGEQIWEDFDEISAQTMEAAENIAASGAYAQERFTEYYDGGFWSDESMSAYQRTVMKTVVDAALEELNADSLESYLASGGTLEEWNAAIDKAYERYGQDLANDAAVNWAGFIDVWESAFKKIHEMDEKNAQAVLTRWTNIYSLIGKARANAFGLEEDEQTLGELGSKDEMLALAQQINAERKAAGQSPLTIAEINALYSTGSRTAVDPNGAVTGTAVLEGIPTLADTGVMESGYSKYLLLDPNTGLPMDMTLNAFNANRIKVDKQTIMDGIMAGNTSYARVLGATQEGSTKPVFMSTGSTSDWIARQIYTTDQNGIFTGQLQTGDGLGADFLTAGVNSAFIQWARANGHEDLINTLFDADGNLVDNAESFAKEYAEYEDFVTNFNLVKAMDVETLQGAQQGKVSLDAIITDYVTDLLGTTEDQQRVYEEALLEGGIELNDYMRNTVLPLYTTQYQNAEKQYLSDQEIVQKAIKEGVESLTPDEQKILERLFPGKDILSLTRDELVAKENALAKSADDAANALGRITAVINAQGYLDKNGRWVRNETDETTYQTKTEADAALATLSSNNPTAYTGASVAQQSDGTWGIVRVVVISADSTLTQAELDAAGIGYTATTTNQDNTTWTQGERDYETYGINRSDVLSMADSVQDTAPEDDTLADRLAIHREDAIEAAKDMLRYSKGIEEVNKGYEKWIDNLDELTEGTIEYRKEAKKMNKATEDILGLDYGTLSDGFFDTLENRQLLKEVLDGTEGSYNKLQKAVIRDIRAQNDQITLTDDLIASLDRLADSSLKTGDLIDTSSNPEVLADINNIYHQLVSAAIAGGKDVAAAMAYANAMMQAVGFDMGEVKVEKVVIPYTSPVGYDTIVEDEMVIDGAHYYDVHTEPVPGGTGEYQVVGTKVTVTSATKEHEGVPPPSGKGGGGGGGKKKPTERKKYSDVERYHEIDKSLNSIKNEMSKIEKLRERAFGPDKIKILDAELRLLQKQKEAQEVLAAEASKWLVSDQELLNSLVDGVEYMEDGRIANWSELQHQWIDEYNAAVAEADKMSKDEEKQEAIEAAQKEYDRKVKALKNYEESLDKILEAGLELEDLVNKISTKLLEKIQYNVEYKMDLNESDLEIMEYYLDTFEDDVFKSAESMDNMMEQITTHLDDLKTLKEGYNELIKEYNNGAGLITDADFQAGLKEFQSQIIDTLGELNDLKKEMKEFYEDVLENASEELENHTEKLDAIVETMESYISIQELMGKGVNYEWVTGIYQTQYEANRALLTANKQYLDTLIQARDEATDPDLIEAYNDAIVEANKSLLESTEAVLETLQKIYENTIASIFDTLDKSLAGTADSVEELSEDYAYYQEVQERYVSTAKELHEVSKLNRDIEKSINETASQTNKNLLKQLQERIKAQSKMNELTQYDLDMNQKQYELLLAKIALEEAQNAKDTVRLVRDANGNYAYQYTADQGKIDEAEQKYEDALYAIHQLSAERIKEMEQEMIDARKTFLDSAKEIAEAEYDSEDERYEDLLKLFDQYKERMTYSYAEYEEATDHLGINAQSFAELFGVSVDEIYGGSSLMNEALGALFALGADATFEDAWAAIQEVMKAAKEREDAVKDATDEAGTSLDGMSGNADQASGAIGGLIGEITDLNTKLGAEFIEVNKVADAWLRLHEVLTSTSLDYEQIAENMQRLQEAIGTEGLGLVLGDLVINGDAMAGVQDTEDQLNPQMPDGTTQYATGGLVDYTGPAWVDGTPSKPELMLNATDTPRFLEAIKIARQINFRRGFGDSSIGQYANIISDTLEASMAAMYDVMANSYHATDSAFRILSAIKSEPIDQNVTIDAHFPSVTNHTEIEDALNNLINQASHFTNRNF